MCLSERTVSCEFTYYWRIDMVTDLIVWMAEKLNKLVPSTGRSKFLDDLMNNEDFVVNVFACDVESLIAEYTCKTGEVTCLNTAGGDKNCFVTCAKAIVRYMKDEMLKDELAALE
jgi:hypothetical protein